MLDYTNQCSSYSSRCGVNIQAIVNHISCGSKQSVVNTFLNKSNSASSHYLVCKDGEVIKFVNEVNAAWTCGNIEKPSAQIVKDMGICNPNFYTINIEHENLNGEPLTELQYKSTLNLHKSLCNKYNIPINREHILGHYQIDSVTRSEDPGKNFPWDRLIKDLGVKVMKNYKEILIEMSSNPQDWQKLIDFFQNNDELGKLNIGKFLPQLLEKIYNK